MEFADLQKNWEGLAQSDPLWAILSLPQYKGNKWSPAEFWATGQAEVAHLLEYIHSLPMPFPQGRALDFGCGIGRITQPLSEHFSHAYGVDIAPTMLALGQRYNQHPQRCHFVLNQADRLGLFADRSFAFIYSVITFQNMAPEFTKAYLSEFLRLLAPGGLLIFQVPSHPIGLKTKVKQNLPRLAMDVFYQLKYRDQPHMEMHAVPQSEVLTLLDQPGIAVVDIQADQRAFAEWASFRYAVQRFS